jgi:hypothetical protein
MKPLKLFSSTLPFRSHLSPGTLHHQKDYRIGPAIHGIRFSVRWFGFPHDETPGTNPTHLTSFSLGFPWGGGFVAFSIYCIYVLNLECVSGARTC